MKVFFPTWNTSIVFHTRTLKHLAAHFWYLGLQRQIISWQHHQECVVLNCSIMSLSLHFSVLDVLKTVFKLFQKDANWILTEFHENAFINQYRIDVGARRYTHIFTHSYTFSFHYRHPEIQLDSKWISCRISNFRMGQAWFFVSATFILISISDKMTWSRNTQQTKW